jgi:non-ribosomal peptide synthetase component F
MSPPIYKKNAVGNPFLGHGPHFPASITPALKQPTAPNTLCTDNLNSITTRSPVMTMILDRVRQVLSHIAPSIDPSDNAAVSPYPGLSYHIGPTSQPLKHVTLGELLREQVALNGDSEALVSAWQGIRWTYRELDEKSDEIARSFWGLGIRKGDRMAIMAGNCGEYVLV